jgi:protein SCO1/2
MKMWRGHSCLQLRDSSRSFSHGSDRSVARRKSVEKSLDAADTSVRATALVFLLFLSACVQPKPLAIMGQIPQFELTSQTGQPFDSKSLDGHIWVADFVYTTCEGPCPMMSSQMHNLQTLTAELPDVKLVSFTVDPAHDTPPVLAKYATHFKPDPNRWWFLTGETARLNDVALNGFKLNSVDGSMSHSTRFALVDQKRRVRAYYISGEDGMLPRLLHDIRQLERYPS